MYAGNIYRWLGRLLLWLKRPAYRPELHYLRGRPSGTAPIDHHASASKSSGLHDRERPG